MNSPKTTLISIWMLAPLLSGVASGQTRRISSAASQAAPPSITILSAPTGALVRSEGAGSAALDLGTVSYFRGASVPGESSRRSSGSLVISTRFALRIDCPGSLPSSQVNVTMSRTDGAATHEMAIDGIKLGTAAQPLAESMACGSSSEHRLEVAVPVSTPQGTIGSTVAFEAALRR
jgi:hypothetical protein